MYLKKINIKLYFYTKKEEFKFVSLNILLVCVCVDMIVVEFYERLVLSKYGKKAGQEGKKSFVRRKAKRQALFKGI